MPRLNKEQKLALERKAFALRLRGKSQYEIARILGISKRTAGRYLLSAYQREVKNHETHVQGKKLESEIMLRQIQQRALDRYDKGKETLVAKDRSQEVTGPNRHGRVVTSLTTELESQEVLSDNRLLDIAVKCETEIKKIWGVDSPVKQELKTESVNPAEIRVLVEYEDKKKTVDEDEESDPEPEPLSDPLPDPEAITDPLPEPGE